MNSNIHEMETLWLSSIETVLSTVVSKKNYANSLLGHEKQNTPAAFLQLGKTPPMSVPLYDTEQSDDEAPVMLELWGMQSTPSLLLHPGLLQLGVVAPDKVLSMGWIEVFDIQTVLMLNLIVWNRTVYMCKNGFGIK